METTWSSKVQSTELLYYSRAEKFNDENRNLWFRLLKVKKDMKILEVGCGGGLFTNMIKTYFPSCQVYGIDLDEQHIKFAKNNAKKLNLDVKYMVANVEKLPFKDECFDLVFSHTVVEHIEFDKFIAEQKRVLKPDGNLVIMRVDMHPKVDRPFDFNEEEIGKIFDQLEIDDTPSVAKFLVEPDVTMCQLHERGFKNIDFKYNRVIFYMPDTQTKQTAIKQIKRNYQTKLYNALFALGRAKNGEEFKDRLCLLLKEQYEKRLQYLKDGKALYDFQSSNVITISAKK